jgi:hypothetical protein
MVEDANTSHLNNIEHSQRVIDFYEQSLEISREGVAD